VAEVAWTAIGLLAATLFGTLFWLGSRIDGLEGRLNGRIDRLETRMESLEVRVANGFDAVNAHLDAHLQRHAT